MSIRVARRTLLKTGIAAGVTVSATSVIAQHSPAKLSTHALDTYQGKPAAGIRIDFSARRATRGNCSRPLRPTKTAASASKER